MRKNKTGKIIKIDENFRIQRIAMNFILQRKQKTRNNSITWKSTNYFPDLESLSFSYLEDAPRRAMKARGQVKNLIKATKTAEKNIIRAIEKTGDKK